MNKCAGWKTWVIYRPVKDAEGKDRQFFVASFARRTECEEYLEFKKEQHFFETGSMDEAEKQWGKHNFIVDYCYVMDRVTTMQQLKVTPEQWRHD